MLTQPDYYGYRDEDDGVILALEMEAEKEATAQAHALWLEKKESGKIEELPSSSFDLYGHIDDSLDVCAVIVLVIPDAPGLRRLRGVQARPLCCPRACAIAGDCFSVFTIASLLSGGDGADACSAPAQGTPMPTTMSYHTRTQMLLEKYASTTLLDGDKETKTLLGQAK